MDNPTGWDTAMPTRGMEIDGTRARSEPAKPSRGRNPGGPHYPTAAGSLANLASSSVTTRS
jgi:hypothetical protein